MIAQSMLGLALALQALVLFNDDEVSINEVGVPAELAARGYTTEIVTRRLRDELRTIVLESGGAHEGAPAGIVNSSFAEQAAELLHVAESVNQIKIMLGDAHYELDSEIVQHGDRLLFDVDLFRLPSGPIQEIVQEVDVNDIDASIDVVARWTISRLDALTMLKYDFVKAKLSDDFTKVADALAASRRTMRPELLPAFDNLEGMVLLARGEATAAEAFFRRALRRDPKLLEAKLNLAVAVAARGAPDAAEALLAEAATDGRPGPLTGGRSVRAAALALRGLIADSRGAEREAIASLRDAVAVDPELAEAHALLAAVLRGRGLGTLARHHEQRVAFLRADLPARLPVAFLDAAVLRRLVPPRGGATDLAAGAAAPVGRS